MKELIKEYFDLEELICPHVSARFGQKAWQFIDTRLLETLYVIRKSIDKPIYVNDWAMGGTLSQRGLRCNICYLVKSKTIEDQVYMSAHNQGEAVDFHVKGMPALLTEDIRIVIDLRMKDRIQIDIHQMHEIPVIPA